MMFRFTVCFILMIASISCCGAPIHSDCVDFSEEQIRQIEEVRSAFINGNVKFFTKHVTFPIKGYMYGSAMNLYMESFEWDWEGIATPVAVSMVKKANLCELTDLFGLEFDAEKVKITQIKATIAKSEQKYSKSGISSYTEFVQFIESVNDHISNQNWKELSQLFDYPFYTIDGLIINNKDEFLKNHMRVFESNFVSIFKEAEKQENLHQRSNGIMLNERGDIWIQQIEGKLKIVILNKFGK